MGAEIIWEVQGRRFGGCAHPYRCSHALCVVRTLLHMATNNVQFSLRAFRESIADTTFSKEMSIVSRRYDFTRTQIILRTLALHYALFSSNSRESRAILTVVTCDK